MIPGLLMWIKYAPQFFKLAGLIKMHWTDVEVNSFFTKIEEAFNEENRESGSKKLNDAFNR